MSLRLALAGGTNDKAAIRRYLCRSRDPTIEGLLARLTVPLRFVALATAAYAIRDDVDEHRLETRVRISAADLNL